jgi:hypothetical protein
VISVYPAVTNRELMQLWISLRLPILLLIKNIIQLKFEYYPDKFNQPNPWQKKQYDIRLIANSECDF